MNRFRQFLSFFLFILSAIILCGFSSKPVRAAAPAPFAFLDDDAEAQTDLSFVLQTAKTGSLLVALDYRDDNNYYAIDCAPGTLELRSVIGGKSHRLASAPVEWKPASQVGVVRHTWLMQVIVDHRVALTAYDASFLTGKIGYRATGAWVWTETRVQPIDELYFTDDFTRQAGQEGEWKPLTGKWTLTSSSDAINERNIEWSANPFAYQVNTPDGDAFTQVGRWFWNNYEAHVSVRPGGTGCVGLAVLAQDQRNYIAFEWHSAESGSARELVRVVDGVPTVLASAPGAYLPRQWYRLTVRTSPGFVEASIDDNLVFKVKNDWFGQGSVGLLARNISTATFDDALVQSYDYYRQDFSGPTGGAWAPQGGSWHLQDGQLLSAPEAGDSGARFFLAGRDDWKGYDFIASTHTGQAGACGLIAGYQSPDDYALFRWAGPQSALPYHGRQQLIRVSGGKETMLSDEPATLFTTADNDSFVRLRVRLKNGAMTVYSNDSAIAQVGDETLGSGRVGLWSAGSATVGFRDVVVSFPPEPVPPRVAQQMESDALMVGWASPSGEWPPSYGDGGTEFWNTGEFFGDAAMEYLWPRDSTEGKLEFSLRSTRGNFGSGYILRFEGEPGSEGGSSLHISLLRGADTLKETQVNLKDLPKVAGPTQAGTVDTATSDDADKLRLRVDLEGRAILCSLDGTPKLTYLIPDPASAPHGPNLAARANGFVLKAKNLRAISTHRDDYTFTDAPTDWYSPQGNWNIISRWPCFSDWSFFGGKGTTPMLWGKQVFSGDTVVEMYSHNQMDLPKEVGYSAPGNLNITIGGDGHNPASGYSFIVAGWDNTASGIYRGTRLVARNDSPRAWFDKPINHNYSYHKKWFYIRAEARRATQDGQAGVKLTLSLDDGVLCEFFDPQPLASFEKGGRVCFWSADSSIILARAKIEAENMGPRSLPAGLIDVYAHPQPASSAAGLLPVAVVDDGQPSAVVATNEAGNGEGGWTVTDPQCGGIFAVRLINPANPKSSSWPVTPATAIDFDIQLSADVKIDLYATVNGQLHLVQLTDDQPMDARTRLLGDLRPTLSAEPGKWRHVHFDLGAALAKTDPGAHDLKIDSLQLGALHGSVYRWVGFDGNDLGASYRIRNINVR